MKNILTGEISDLINVPFIRHPKASANRQTNFSYLKYA